MLGNSRPGARVIRPRTAIALGGALTLPAAAQVLVPPPVPSKADVAAVQADTQQLRAKIDALALTVPRAATATPPGEAVNPTVGTAGTYRPADAVPPRITRAGLVVTASSTGLWSITWSTPLPAAPVSLPIPMNTGTQPIICNVATSTMQGATGRCWLARTLPAAIVSLSGLVNYDVNAAPAAGITVQVLAIPTTQ